MNNKTALGFATSAVILNGLIGHYFAPKGIMLTPIVLTITTYLVCLKTKNIKVVKISLLTYLFVALNDFSIKLYAGGSHDYEGLAWIYLLLFVGLVPTTGILFSTVFRQKDEKLTTKIIALFIFVVLIIGHLLIFRELGLGRYYGINWNGE